MTGGGERFPSTLFTEGKKVPLIDVNLDLGHATAIDWKALKEGSVVVDVGGSVGSVVHTLVQEYPHLHYVVQDLPPVINGEAKAARTSRLLSSARLLITGCSSGKPRCPPPSPTGKSNSR